MKILITGGRLYNVEVPADVQEKDKQFFIKTIEELRPTLLIHGAAKGADRHFSMLAAVRFPELSQEPVVPNWDLHGKSAAFVRNEKMAKMLDPKEDVLLVFHGWNGTRHQISVVREVGAMILKAPSYQWQQRDLFK